jgi:hypothetical protein
VVGKSQNWACIFLSRWIKDWIILDLLLGPFSEELFPKVEYKEKLIHDHLMLLYIFFQLFIFY